MDRLLAGYRRFRAKIWPEARKRYEKLATGGQRPETLVIACSDSRVDPATVFNAGPGELFTIRNVANLVPPYQPDGGYHGASAAVEFAVRVLKVSRIVVMGHARCGGVQAMVEGAPLEAQDFVVPWMSIAESVRSEVNPACSREENLRRCEAGVVRLSAANLMTFPWIREAVEEGRLSIHTYVFGIDDGLLLEVLPDCTRPAV